MSSGSSEMSMEAFNPEEFFRLMFGGEQFADIIGDFEVAKAFKHAISQILKETEQTRDQREEEQRERILARKERIDHLSIFLISKLSIYTDAFQTDHHEVQSKQVLNRFIEIMNADIPDLLQAPYGEHLLHSIGYIYSSKAQFWLSKMDSQEGHIGKRMVGSYNHFKSTWKHRAHVVKETVRTVKSAVQAGQSMSKLAQVAEQESNDSQNGNDSQYPFQHHSGHLEYSGFIPPETTASASPTYSNRSSTPPVKSRSSRKSSAQPVVPLTDDEKRRLEADTAAKSMEALWRVIKLEIESVERDVCDQVLNDTSCPRDIRRRRCVALSKLGELWQQASS